MAPVFAFSVLALTVGLSLSRPRVGRFRIHHAQAGVIGGLLTVLLGVAPPSVFATAARLLVFPVTTIVSLMIITLVAERAGLFAVLSDALARRAHGNARTLFALLFWTGTLVGTVFTNDAAVLIFTPLVFHLVERIGTGWRPENKLPFYFAVLYIANLVGALVIANPINIVVSSLFRIQFLEYARWMALPALVSIAVSFVGLALFFGRLLPRRFAVPPPRPQTESRRAFAAICACVLALTLIGLFTETVTGLPTWAVAAAGAAVLLALQVAFAPKGLRPVISGVGWDVILFVCGMFVVGLGLKEAGVTLQIGDLIQRLSGGDFARMRLSTGLVAAGASAVINNHPTANVMSWVIQGFALPGVEKRLLAFAALIGGDLGPKMLPIGSLAALMWFRMLRDRGVQIPYSLYIRVGVPVTLAAVVLSLLALNLESFLASAVASW